VCAFNIAGEFRDTERERERERQRERESIWPNEPIKLDKVKRDPSRVLLVFSTSDRATTSHHTMDPRCLQHYFVRLMVAFSPAPDPGPLDP
jgi:hypothetical protein